MIGDTKTRYPAEESLSAGRCCRVWYRDGFRPSCGSVNGGEQVSEAVGEGKRANDVHMNVLESPGGLWKGSEGWGGVALNLAGLAVSA